MTWRLQKNSYLYSSFQALLKFCELSRLTSFSCFKEKSINTGSGVWWRKNCAYFYTGSFCKHYCNFKFGCSFCVPTPFLLFRKVEATYTFYVLAGPPYILRDSFLGQVRACNLGQVGVGQLPFLFCLISGPTRSGWVHFFLLAFSLGQVGMVQVPLFFLLSCIGLGPLWAKQKKALYREKQHYERVK